MGKRKSAGVIAVVLLLIAAGFVGYFLYRNWSKAEQTPSEAASGYSIPVISVTIDDLIPEMSEPETEQPIDAEEEPVQEDLPLPTEQEPEPEPEPEQEPLGIYEQLSGTPSFDDLGMTLEAGRAFLYDLNEGRLLAIKGAGEVLYPASTTKLLTILTALEYLEPDTQITAGNEIYLVGENSSVAWVGLGQVLTAEQLAAGMLIPSGNDASYVLAAAVGRKLAEDPGLSGSEASNLLVPLMNEIAAGIGMEHSSFSNVDGYFAQDHYSTVEDMLLLALAAYDNPIIRKYCGMAEMEAPHIADFNWVTSNDMLLKDNSWYDARVKGMKTGSLSGDYCLIAILEQDGHTYLSGVFSCGQKYGRYRDTQTILEYLFPEA